MSTAAQPVLPAPVSPMELSEDELVRASRRRRREGRLAGRSRLAFAAAAAGFVAAAAACAMLLDSGPRLSWPTAALFVAVYAVISRVEFEIGTGAAIPTELVLVPMLFALPAGTVPAFVALAL